MYRKQSKFDFFAYTEGVYHFRDAIFLQQATKDWKTPLQETSNDLDGVGVATPAVVNIDNKVLESGMVVVFKLYNQINEFFLKEIVKANIFI